MDSRELFDRETRAGHDRARMEAAHVLLVGCGAIGSNLTQNAALSGIGTHTFIDFDQVELSNVTRSPCFRRERLRGPKARFKARELARSFLDLSYAERPVARSAIVAIEELGLGAFEGVDVVIAAVDSLEVRAYLADTTRFLGIPLVEVGFSHPIGHVAVFPNREASEPCWRCLHPTVEHGSASCALYAKAAIAAGRTPATQPLAAAFAAMTTEAVIAALHGEFPLGNQMLHLDVRTGRSIVARIAADPDCPGVHASADTIETSEVRAETTVAAFLKVVARDFAEPTIELRSSFLVSAPCGACARTVTLMAPAWKVRSPPACSACAPGEESAPEPPVVLTSVSAQDSLARSPLARLGYRSADVVKVVDRATGAIRYVRLAGSSEQLFLTWKRAEAATSTDHAAEPAAVEAREPIPTGGFRALG